MASRPSRLSVAMSPCGTKPPRSASAEAFWLAPVTLHNAITPRDDSPMDCPSRGTSLSLASTTESPRRETHTRSWLDPHSAARYPTPSLTSWEKSKVTGTFPSARTPKSIRSRVFSSTRRMSVGEDAAPPMTMRRRLLKCNLRRSGQFTSAVAMMGTRLKE